MGTLGTDLLQQLMNGEVERATPETVNRVRDHVTPALVELLDIGARARPLLLNGRHVGFVRGLHLAERRRLFTWYPEPDDRLFHIMALATTLTPEAINQLDGYEAQTVIQLISKCTEADISLYPYIQAFGSTSASEILWYGRGADVATWSQRELKIPGGFSFDLIAPPDHARLWVGVATIRERSKRRLDDSFNAAIVARAMVGKGADKMFQALKKTQESLLPDNPDLWMSVVKLEHADIDFNDGWGHSHQDESVGGILREIDGMAKMDKHEQFFDDFYKRQMAEAQSLEEEMEKRFREAMAHSPIEDRVSILSDVEVRNLNTRLATQRAATDAFVADAVGESQRTDDLREARAEAAQQLARKRAGGTNPPQR